MISITIKTWSCRTCGYLQDFDPEDAALTAQHHPEIRGLPVGHCPACWTGRTDSRVKQASRMVPETDPARKVCCHLEDASDLSARENLTKTEKRARLVASKAAFDHIKSRGLHDEDVSAVNFGEIA